MKFKEYFEIYAKFKTGCKLKKFPPFMTRKNTLNRYIINHKSEVLHGINFVFKRSDEPYSLCVFSSENANMICVNTAYFDHIPRRFENRQDYEKYTNLYGIFAVLLNRSFKISGFDDSRIHETLRDYLADLSFDLRYDDDFILNLQNIVLSEDNKILRLIYRYGDDFLKTIFTAFIKNEFSEDELMTVFDDDKEVGQNELQGLYELYNKQNFIGLEQ